MTHDEKIVEAVARAIADHFHKDADFGMDGASAYAARPREFQDTARAAITAYQAEAWQGEAEVEAAAIRIIRNRASDGPSADWDVKHARQFDTDVWRDAKRDARAALSGSAR